MSELTKEHVDEVLEKPVTNKYLLDFTKEIIFPGVRKIVREENIKFRDEILTSNDNLAKKLDQILTEQKAITAGIKRLQMKINYLEAVVKVLAEKEGLQFSPPES